MPSEADKSNTCQTALLGVCLSKQPATLLKEVEQLCGAPVHARLGTEYNVGGADVSEQGPFIVINPYVLKETKTRQEAAIVHELLHLKLRAKGFGGVKYEPTETRFYNIAGPFLEEMVGLIHAPIEHYIIFPEMRGMGFDPGIEVKHYCSSVLEGKEKEPIDDDQRAVFFFRALLETNDQKLISKLMSFYESKHWNGPMALGKKLAQIVKDSNPRAPDDVANVYASCMNTLLERRARLEFKGWFYFKRGRFEVKVARMWIVPLIQL